MNTKEIANDEKEYRLDQKKSPWRKPGLWVIQSKDTQSENAWWPWPPKTNNFGPNCS
jgi:hypothetical protein